MWMKNLANGLTLHDVVVWLDGLDSGYADRKSGVSYTATDVTKGVEVNDGTEMVFNGSSSVIALGNIGNVNGVILWVKPTTANEYLVDLDGTSTISITNGAIATASITSPTIYVNGEVRTAITVGSWNHVVVTWATAIDASDCNLGQIASNFLEGSVTKVVLLNKVITQVQAGQMFSGTAPFSYTDTIASLIDAGNLTFAKDYSESQDSADADWSYGSYISTVTASRGASNPATYIEKQSANALLFDGVDDKVQKASFSSITAYPFTLYAEFNADRIDTYETVFGISDISQGDIYYLIQLRLGEIHLVARNTSFKSVGTTGITWGGKGLVKVACVFTSNTSKSLYVNGALVGTLTDSVSFSSGIDTLTIGNTGDSGSSNFFGGEIKNCKLYSKALSPSEITTLYNGGSVTSGLVSHYDFSDGSGSTLTDKVGSNNGTISGAKWLTAGTNYIKKEVRSDQPRFTQGFYDTTGFVSRPGIYEEGARTNLLTYSTFSAGTTISTGWTNDDDVTGSPTYSLVPETLTGIPGSQAQRIVYASAADPGSYIQFLQNTAVGSFAQNDYITLSVWAKGSVSGATFKLSSIEKDASAVSGTAHSSSDFVSSLSSTEWRRFTYSVQLTDADLSLSLCRVLFDGVGANVSIDIQLAGFQVENAPFASTFIPTTTAALQRNAETLKYPILGNRTAASESIYVKFTPFYSSAQAPSSNLTMTSTDTKDRRMVVYSNNYVFKPNITDSNASDATKTIAWDAYVSRIITAVAQHSSPYASVYLNGSSPSTDTSDDFTNPAWGTYFWIGCLNDGASQLYGIIESTAFFSRAHSATTVASITNTINGV